MSDSSSERNYSKRHRKHSKRSISPAFFEEHRRKHKSHKRKSSEKNFEEKKRKIKTEQKECLTVKTEVKDRLGKRQLEEPQERPSGSRSKSNAEGQVSSRDRGDHEWGDGTTRKKAARPATEVQKPNFSLSGKLAEDTNIYNGVVIKYSEPPEARMPKKRWRLYPFKGDQGLPTLYIHRQSAYLLGRDRKVVDISIDHPSCSKQHAALQYRQVSYKRPNGSLGKQIRLYIIDLESANGTFINNNKIEARKYVELFEKDVIKFGYSSREYVLLHEHSKDDSENES